MRTKKIPLTFLEPVHIIHNHCCIRNDEQFNSWEKEWKINIKKMAKLLVDLEDNESEFTLDFVHKFSDENVIVRLYRKCCYEEKRFFYILKYYNGDDVSLSIRFYSMILAFNAVSEHNEINKKIFDISVSEIAYEIECIRNYGNKNEPRPI
ncbi:hypothetical protein [Moraxella equi]|uniref:Uncharacterized protein n=1 Tax=Moraxella equi TaxID=60442 RepID=A0A378UTU6_9GAMM|nr:hypothetical protein [Moraxella equi]OPH37661.1 hypothetical protein B5J93_08040 [Moraxella equi]STZ82923.1 Uncharacterised protein [Moraxella equi]